jgi:class 3 adenylate cyclase/streptogramin lyase
MPRQAVRRHLATVLFLDIVGSTALASELGDARWRELLTRFRRLVREELKRHGGREQDTAGDGFFAAFEEPARALACAAAIVVAVQQLGVDVRAGVHTGECEEIDGKLGGIAAHIGSRIMALAGPAEVLTTGTVMDLVAGSRATFEDRGVRELKGVEGSRQVFSLRAVETRLPDPLSPDEAAERLALIPAAASRRPIRLVLAAAALVVGAAVAVPLLAFGGATEAKPQTAIDLIRINGHTGRVKDVSHDALNRENWNNLDSGGGTLWQYITQKHKLLARDGRSGRIDYSFPIDIECRCQVALGFGSIWLLGNGMIHGNFTGTLSRVDDASGRVVKRIALSAPTTDGTVAIGNGAAWVLLSGGELLRIDPITNRITRTYQTHAIETTTLVPLAGFDWVCECQNNEILRFDPRTGRGKTFSIPTHAFLVGIQSSTLWLLDPGGSTLTAYDPRTGRPGTVLGLGGDPIEAVVAFGSMWAAAGHIVDRVDLKTKARSTIAMPKGVWAGSIAADSASGTIWVGNSGKAPPPPRP